VAPDRPQAPVQSQPTTPIVTPAGTGTAQVPAETNRDRDGQTRSEDVPVAGVGGTPTVNPALPLAQDATTPVNGPTAAATPDQAPDPAAQGQQVADQVVKHLVAARVMRDGTQHTVLHLRPVELGAVTVTVDVKAGEVRLSMSAGDTALSALRQGLGDLRTELAKAGLDLADVTLQPSNDSGQPAGTGTGSREQAQQSWTESRNRPQDGPRSGEQFDQQSGQLAGQPGRQGAGQGSGGDSGGRQGQRNPSYGQQDTPAPRPATRPKTSSDTREGLDLKV
jgi:flagellar hook-length control protein FliK